MNVPVRDGKVIDDFRIKKSLPTLEFIRNAGAKIILISHIEGETKTLRYVYDYLNTFFPLKAFVLDYLTDESGDIRNLDDGEAVLCENLRLNDGEKNNDEIFVRNLSAIADIYINEAFSVSHRPHASIVGIPRFLPSYAGFLFDEEVTSLSQALSPLHPAFFVLGGAKFETKLPLLEKFLNLYDRVFVGGALANDLLKARGYKVGRSTVSKEILSLDRYLQNQKLMVPADVIVKSGNERKEKSVNEVADEDIICDAGGKTMELVKEVVRKSKLVLWNGPLGNYEFDFIEGTKELANIVSASEATTIVGGGDTLAAIASLNLYKEFNFVSTGGGAMLQFLADETLPGIKALEESGAR